MRGAWGKSYGTVARCSIGQVLMPIRTKEVKCTSAVEALRRAKFKFPGRLEIHVSARGLYTIQKDDFKKWKQLEEATPVT